MKSRAEREKTMEGWRNEHASEPFNKMKPDILTIPRRRITRVKWPFRLTRKFDEPKGRKTFLSDVCQQNHCVIGE
jgi:hypothetical protein